MICAKIVDGEIAAYPYTDTMLRDDYPGTSFPAEIDMATMDDFGVTVIAEVEPPALEPGEELVEGDPELIDGVWTQVHAVLAATPEKLDAAKAALWEQVKRKRDAVIEEGVHVGGIGTFDTDLVSRTNISGAVTGAMLAVQNGSPFSINWKLKDNTIASLGAAQMIGVGVALLTQMSAIHAYAQTLLGAITTSADFAELEAIDIEAGWPS